MRSVLVGFELGFTAFGLYIGSVGQQDAEAFELYGAVLEFRVLAGKT